MGKLYALQVVRALAAILVVWVHVNTNMESQGLPVFGHTISGLRDIGSCGVDLFFVLSGFIVSLSAVRSQNPNTFIARRFLRIYPLYWVIFALYIVVNPGFFAPGFPLSHAEVVGRLSYSSLLLPAPVPSKATGPPWMPTSWTLVHEVFFYLCLYCGMRLRRDARLFSVLAVVGVVALNVVLYGILRKTVPFVVYYGSPVALEFALGVGLGWLLPKLKLAKPWPMVLVVLGTLGFIATAIHIPITNASVRTDLPNAMGRVLVWGVPAVFVVGGLSLLNWKPRSKFGKASVFVGDACYSMYLFQWFPLRVASFAMPALYRATGSGWTTLLVVVFASLCGIAFYCLVERPLTHRLNHRFFPKAPATADAGVAPPELEKTLTGAT